MPLNKSIHQRLLDKSILNPTTGCREWIAQIHKATGYGQIRYNTKQIGAHRMAWIVRNGSIPPNMLVCHRCDNRRCINVDHLFLGTQKDNLADMISKGRSASGAKHPQAKLTSNDVIAIRNDPRDSREIAEAYGVHRMTIYAIKNKRRWKSL